jgi:hypothetical protein
MPKWLPLMRTGEFTDRHKKTFKVTADNLEAIQKNYNAQSPAHLVVGHPDRSSVPSFGIADALRFVGDTLFFRPAKIVHEFGALVAKGGFPHVSAGVDLINNKLDHIAFLSAENPAIDGLAPIAEFSRQKNDTDVVTIDITDTFSKGIAEFSSLDSWFKWRLQDIGNLFSKFRDYLIEKEGRDAADKTIPDYMVNGLLESPPVEPEQLSAQFSSNEGGEMDPVLKQQLDAANVKVNELTGKLAEFQASAATLQQTNTELTARVEQLTATIASLTGEKQVAEFSSFVEKLIDEKKVLPAEKDALVKELAVMAKASNLAEFSQAGATDTPLAIFKAKLEARPKSVPGEEHTADLRNAEFSQGGVIDPAKLGKLAQNYMAEQAAKGVVVSSKEAVAYLMAAAQ